MELTANQNGRRITTANLQLWLAEERGLVFWKFIGNIYCMLSTGPHTWTVSTSVRVPKHEVRSAFKGLEMTELCFIVVGLLARIYMWSRNPDSVVKKKKEKKICIKVWFGWWDESDGNVPVGKTVAPIHGKESLTATLIVRGLKMVTFPVRSFYARPCVRAWWQHFRPEPALMWILCTEAAVSCHVDLKKKNSGVNKHCVCQMQLNMYLW